MGLIGEIYAKAGLQVDNSGFAAYSAQLKSAEGNISSFAAAHSAALIGVGTAMVGTIGGVAAYGVSLAAGYEKTQLQLEGLLGSQQKAGEMMKWLQNFAATTPFEFPELAEASAKFLSAGMNAKEFMTIVGDVASGTNKSIDQVTEAFIDAQSGEWERLKELGIQHVEIQKTNYEQLGATVDQVGQDMLYTYDANGKKLVEIFDKSSKEATEAALKNLSVDKFSGSMDKVASSLSGKWSTIKDNINNSLVDIVGFEVGEKQASGLYAALQKLADVAISVTGGLSGLSEPMQTAISIAAVGGLAVGGLAIGIGLVGAASTLATPGMSALAVSINAAIWPATAIVVGLGLLAAGLILLEEKTGLVSAAWQTAKDLFTIFVDAVEGAASDLSSWVVSEFDKIKQAAEDIIPQSVIDKVEGFAGWVSEKVGGWTGGIHEEAEGIRAKNKASNTKSQETDVTADTGQAVRNVTTLDGMVKLLGSDSKKTTADMSSMGSVSMSGTSGQVTGLDNTVKKTQGSSKQLRIYLDDAGHVTMNGTNSQLSMIDSKGKSTKVTISQALGILTAAGNANMSGTVNQLGLVDSKGKVVKLTTEQATNLLKQAGSQSMSGTVSGINDIVSAWNKARTAANEYAKMAISNREAEKIIEGSTSTGQTKNGVTVVGAGQSIQSHNVKTDIHVNTINYNNPTASNRGTLKIISRS